jgi:hypothetical protein
VTAALSAGEAKLPPIQHQRGFDPFRYAPGGYSNSACSVGLASRFADKGGSPMWLRYNKTTPARATRHRRHIRLTVRLLRTGSRQAQPHPSSVPQTAVE